MSKAKISPRTWIQIGFTAISNGYVNGFLSRSLYHGGLKRLCVPGLNCYSCPGALGACPIGALQAVLSSPKYHFSFYVIGFLLAFGAFFGRVVCGFLCPFGLVQDLLHRIPFPAKLKRIPGDRFWRLLKYAILVVLVLLLPALVTNIIGQGDPWFCKYLCPSGTLMGGIPQLLLNPALREAVGGLFWWKLGVLIFLLLLSVVHYRPFCKYLCPLGAIYGLCNPVALTHMEVDANKCTHCGACRRACPMNVPLPEKPNHPECIRCGACRQACPENAISLTLRFKGIRQKGKEYEENHENA